VKKSNNETEYKMAIITRSDLKLSTGKLAVQVAHAAVICALDTKKKNSKWFNKWQNEGAKKVVLKVDGEEDLFPLRDKAQELKMAAHIITDAGHTEIPAGTITVLGIGPAPENIMDQITGNLETL
jgi:PTH2 family peptidyl-tRNA hydrolase